MSQGNLGEARDNAALGRFELEVDGHLAIAEYRIAEGVIEFFHTVSPPALRGLGAASKLIHGALLAARERGLKVKPTCSFVAAYIERHREFADLLE